jgi:hypothetical protein
MPQRRNFVTKVVLSAPIYLLILSGMGYLIHHPLVKLVQLVKELAIFDRTIHSDDNIWSKLKF